MKNVTVKYVKKSARDGHYVYRRRVPKVLAGKIPQTEFVKTLGRTLQDALVNYGPFHQRIEHMIALAKNGVTSLSPAEQRDRLVAMLQSWNADPHSPGRDDNERTWREVEADKLIDRYQNPETGEYEGVPEETHHVATALLGGVSAIAPGPTVTDAFKFYLEENAKSIPEQRKKQIQRFARAEKSLIAVLRADKLVSDITRADARKWRDMREAAGVSPATIKRERSDISTVVSTAISELDVPGINPFIGLKLKKAVEGRHEEREPLPPEVIVGVYSQLAKQPELLRVWTLLDFTGARPSEIRDLLASEIVLDHDVPHIVIRERYDRTLKTTWSRRTIPLIGDALQVAQDLVRGRNDPTSPVFPRYHGEGGMDRMSQALNRRIRKLTKNPKHVTYSLRHNMKDRMRQAEVYADTQKALEGHAFSKGQDASYGGEVPLETKRNALINALGGAGMLKPETTLA
ncbi:site-specific integrase [Marinovum sp. 2_MG-2023]|uniref:tyrosine-type recombinase/integrase n=1 Tax=unclassified Marinovum TaxID=2647166 RepID=UPI0026E224E0|nr:MULTISPECIES: site-specific integrase [unclassified Marinovum]MDO6732887.1 site-specific integrase [Marinovum sp. 2_MG-2023]MDO6782164.1 site-specific integrase [Marinovum sp. 1_MG-2023]